MFSTRGALYRKIYEKKVFLERAVFLEKDSKNFIALYRPIISSAELELKEIGSKKASEETIIRLTRNLYERYISVHRNLIRDKNEKIINKVLKEAEKAGLNIKNRLEILYRKKYKDSVVQIEIEFKLSVERFEKIFSAHYKEIIEEKTETILKKNSEKKSELLKKSSRILEAKDLKLIDEFYKNDMLKFEKEIENAFTDHKANLTQEMNKISTEEELLKFMRSICEEVLKKNTGFSEQIDQFKKEKEYYFNQYKKQHENHALIQLSLKKKEIEDINVKIFNEIKIQEDHYKVLKEIKTVEAFIFKLNSFKNTLLNENRLENSEFETLREIFMKYYIQAKNFYEDLDKIQLQKEMVRKNQQNFIEQMIGKAVELKNYLIIIDIAGKRIGSYKNETQNIKDQINTLEIGNPILNKLRNENEKIYKEVDHLVSSLKNNSFEQIKELVQALLLESHISREICEENRNKLENLEIQEKELRKNFTKRFGVTIKQALQDEELKNHLKEFKRYKFINFEEEESIKAFLKDREKLQREAEAVKWIDIKKKLFFNKKITKYKGIEI